MCVFRSWPWARRRHQIRTAHGAELGSDGDPGALLRVGISISIAFAVAALRTDGFAGSGRNGSEGDGDPPCAPAARWGPRAAPGSWPLSPVAARSRTAARRPGVHLHGQSRQPAWLRSLQWHASGFHALTSPWHLCIHALILEKAMQVVDTKVAALEVLRKNNNR